MARARRRAPKHASLGAALASLGAPAPAPAPAPATGPPEPTPERLPFRIATVRGPENGGWRADTIRSADGLGALCSLPPHASGMEPSWIYGEASSLPDTLARARAGKAPAGALDALRATAGLVRPHIRRMHGLHGAAIRRRVYADAGDEVDTDRWRTGLAECWSVARRKAAPVGVRLAMGMSQTGGNGAAEFAKVGAIAGACVEACRAAGLGVELIGVMAADLKVRAGAFAIPERVGALVFPLSGPGRPLTGPQLAALGYPGFQRAAGFAFRACAWGSDDPGFAQTIEPPDAMMKALGIDAFIGHTWTLGTPESQAERVVGFVKGLLHTRTGI